MFYCHPSFIVIIIVCSYIGYKSIVFRIKKKKYSHRPQYRIYEYMDVYIIQKLNYLSFEYDTLDEYSFKTKKDAEKVLEQIKKGPIYHYYE